MLNITSGKSQPSGSMRAKMDRMDPIIRDFGRPDKKGPQGLLSLGASFNVARLVALALRGVGRAPGAVAPRMLGVKETRVVNRNALRPSWSAVDLSDEGILKKNP